MKVMGDNEKKKIFSNAYYFELLFNDWPKLSLVSLYLKASDHSLGTDKAASSLTLHVQLIPYSLTLTIGVVNLSQASGKLM